MPRIRGSSNQANACDESMSETGLSSDQMRLKAREKEGPWEESHGPGSEWVAIWVPANW